MTGGSTGETSSHPKRPRQGPLSHSSFRWLLAARTTAILGNAVAPIALAFAVLDLTGSPTDLGLVVAARSLANVAVLLFGGVLADRLPRDAVLVGASAAAAITQGVVAGLVLSGNATIPWLIILSLLNGAVAAVSLPAAAALVPETVPEDLLRPANALLRLSLNGGSILGASIGAGVVGVVGPGWGLGIDAAAFALAAVLFARMRPPKAPLSVDGRPTRSVLTELRHGWREFSSRRWVWIVVAQFAVLNAASTGAITVLGPAIADGSFGRAAWGFVVGAQTLGLILGAGLALLWHPRKALGIAVISMAVTALPVVTLGVLPELPALLLAFLLSGVVVELFGIAWDQTLQANVPRAVLSRVYSYDMVGSFAAVPLGAAVAGPVAEVIGIEQTLGWLAGLIVIATIIAASTRSVWRVDAGDRPLP